MAFCRICGSDNRSDIIQSIDTMALKAPKQFTYHACRDCGTWQISTIPANIGDYYAADYYSYHESDDPGKKRNDVIIAKAMIKKFNLTEDSSVLDYGAGNIGLLKTFYDEGVGVDGKLYKLRAFDAFAPMAEWRGIKLQNTLPTDMRFDFILSKHVIEHEVDPYQHINNLLNLLAPGGAVRLAMPNAASYAARHFRGHWTGIDAPRHLHVLTPKAVKLIAGKCGGVIDDEEYQCIWMEFLMSRAFKEGRNWRTKDAYLAAIKEADRVRYSHFCNTLAELKDGSGWNATLRRAK